MFNFLKNLNNIYFTCQRLSYKKGKIIFIYFKGIWSGTIFHQHLWKIKVFTITNNTLKAF